MGWEEERQTDNYPAPASLLKSPGVAPPPPGSPPGSSVRPHPRDLGETQNPGPWGPFVPRGTQVLI